MAYADTLSDATRRKARRDAIISAIFGCVSEQAINTGTLLILYFSMLGGGDALAMFSTAVPGVATALLSIPAAGLVARLGLRRSYRSAIVIQTVMFLLIAAAPFAGNRAATWVVMAAFAVYSVVGSFYGAAWFPLVDNFLRADERGGFFGSMRFAYMLVNMFLIYGVGRLMGEKPPLWIIQLYFAAAGAGLLVRYAFLERLPVGAEREAAQYRIGPALRLSLGNVPLVGFSFYYGFLNLAALGAFPLALIYMKSFLGYGASTVMAVTAVGLLGQIAGFALVGLLIRKLGLRRFGVLTHLLFLGAIGLLLVTGPDRPWSKPLLTALFFANGMATAFLGCFGSTGMLALARPGNKVMAMAFVSTFQYFGTGLGRLGTTGLMALGVLAERWRFGGRVFASFHTFFLIDFALTVLGLTFLLLLPAMNSDDPARKAS